MRKQKRTQKSLSENSRAAKLLLEIANGLDPLLTFSFAPTLVARYGMNGVRRIQLAKEYARRREEMKRLEKRKLIKIQKTAECYHVALTDEGSRQAFRLKVLQTDLFTDNRVCMVVFDIPETQRKLRTSLRQFLTTAGFIPIQKSVWISPFDAGEPLAALFRSTDASKWVRLFTGVENK